jgi:hypothetical protein
MKQLIKSFMALVFIGLGNMTLLAQEATATAGGEASGSGGAVSFTVGQVVFTNHTDSLTGTVSQGVQHGFEIFTLGVDKSALNTVLNLFPNPTSEKVSLQISNYNHEKFSYLLFDLQGKLLVKGQIISELTQLDLNNLPKASYFVQIVNQDNKQIKLFKIIKN